jgi:hypothetical protein
LPRRTQASKCFTLCGTAANKRTAITNIRDGGGRETFFQAGGALDLSFIGWYLLGALALGIGVLFVRPYVDAVKAELYLVLRQLALEQGMCTHEELRIA